MYLDDQKTRQTVSIIAIVLAAALLFSCSKKPVITEYHEKNMGPVSYNEHGVAYIITEKSWVAINKDKKVLFYPYIFDNAPDEPREGLQRFTENGKIGFVDVKGQVVIKAQFDFAEPFNNQRARACLGCKKIYSGEHFTYKGGDWFDIDKTGARIP